MAVTNIDSIKPNLLVRYVERMKDVMWIKFIFLRDLSLTCTNASINVP
jgi:hypothetical protein